MIKIDPYINVDAGTMSPYQHGEVYVTEDGAETDLDLGNYSRFTRPHRAGQFNHNGTGLPGGHHQGAGGQFLEGPSRSSRILQMRSRPASSAWGSSPVLT